MGGGGGGGGGYEPYYQAYQYSPTGYRGEDQYNNASASHNANSAQIINNQIIPNMVNTDYYRLVNRLHLEATESVNNQTNAYIENYPQHILSKIITIEEAYSRINDYIQFFSTFDKIAFQTTLDKHKNWFEKTKTELCALIKRAEYYRDRLNIEKTIKQAIVANRKSYLNNITQSQGANSPFELVIPVELSRDDNFKISYINELANEGTGEGDDRRFRLYMSLPTNQTDTV